MIEFIVGFVLAMSISLIAYKLRMLTLSGMIAATLIGGTIFAFGGISASVLLITFFLTGSLLGRLSRSKGERRNWKQVVCNGIIPAISVLIIALRHDLREEISLLFLGALATATADTWATEIGMKYGRKFYNIFTFRPTHRGPSGAISFIGLAAGIAGALLIGAISLIRFSETDPLCGLVLVKVIPVITVSGSIGMLIDSFLGATLQGKFIHADGSITETKSEGTVRHSGISIIGNNATNLIATLWGGVIAIWLGFVM